MLDIILSETSDDIQRKKAGSGVGCVCVCLSGFNMLYAPIQFFSVKSNLKNGDKPILGCACCTAQQERAELLCHAD